MGGGAGHKVGAGGSGGGGGVLSDEIGDGVFYLLQGLPYDAEEAVVSGGGQVAEVAGELVVAVGDSVEAGFGMGCGGAGRGLFGPVVAVGVAAGKGSGREAWKRGEGEPEPVKDGKEELWSGEVGGGVDGVGGEEGVGTKGGGGAVADAVEVGRVGGGGGEGEVVVLGEEGGGEGGLGAAVGGEVKVSQARMAVVV